MAAPTKKCLQVQTIWTNLTLTYLQCIEGWSLSLSHCADRLLLRCLSSCRRLVLLSCHTLILLLFSHCAALLPSNRADWLLRRLSSHRRLVLLLSSHCATLSSSNRTGWLLCCHLLCCRLVLSSRRTLVLLSSSHCAALLSSHHAVWLLRCHSLCLPLVLLSRCPLVLSLRAG